jgi:hypothetical protein
MIFTNRTTRWAAVMAVSMLLGLASFGAGGSMAQEVADTDLDGLPDDVDACPTSILGTTVVLAECDSGVPNTLFPTGCTLSDLIGQCAAKAQNHGKFVSCVTKLTTNLKRSKAITGKQKGAIQNCAAQADLP